MPLRTQQIIAQKLRGTRPSMIPSAQEGPSMDETLETPVPQVPSVFPRIPAPLPNISPPPQQTIGRSGFPTALTPKQQLQTVGNRTETARGLGLLSSVPGGLDEYQDQMDARTAGAKWYDLSNITQPIFDMLQSGQFASAGAALEYVRGGTAWDMFKRASLEFANAMPVIDLEEFGATKPSYSQVLKEMKVFDDDGYGPWGQAAGGLALDILLDPMTYVGAGIAKKAIGLARGAVSDTTAQAIRKTKPVAWLRKAFLPDIDIKDLERIQDVAGQRSLKGVGDKYLQLRTEFRAGQAQQFEGMKDRVIEIAAGMTPEERRLMGVYLDQPTRLNNLIRQISSGQKLRNGMSDYEFLTTKATDLRKHFRDTLAKVEITEGVLDPSMMRANYAPARGPSTRQSQRAWDQIVAERGIKPGILENVDNAIAQAPGIDVGLPQAPIGGALAQVLGQGKSSFMKPKTFATVEERILAGLPTELDIALSTAQRSLESVRQVTTKKFIDSVLSDPSIALRISEEELPFISQYSYTKAASDKGYGIFKPLNADAYYLLPKPIIEDLTKANDIFGSNKVAKEFFGVASTVTNWWKGWALFSPGFHMRNSYSNIMLNWLGGVYTPAPYLHSLAAMAGAEGHIIPKAGAEAGSKIPYSKIIQEMKDQGIYRLPSRDMDLARGVQDELTGFLRAAQAGRAPISVSATGDLGAALAASVGEGRSIGGSPTLGGIIQSMGPNGKLLQWNRQIGTTIEDSFKAAHYIQKRIVGRDPISAARSVKKYLFDYTRDAFTPFERDIIKPLVPFYSWLRSNLPLQIEALITNPGRYSKIPKAIQNYESLSSDWKDIPTPDYFQEIMAVRLTKEISEGLGGAPIYVNPNLPFQDLNKMNFSEALSQMNPFIKFGGEWMSGYSSFLQQPIEKYPGELGDFGFPKKWEYFAESLLPPVGKVARLAKRYSQGAGFEQALSEGLGMKLIRVDVDKVLKARSIKQREAVRSAKDKMRDIGALPPNI